MDAENEQLTVLYQKPETEGEAAADSEEKVGIAAWIGVSVTMLAQVIRVITWTVYAALFVLLLFHRYVPHSGNVIQWIVGASLKSTLIAMCLSVTALVCCIVKPLRLASAGILFNAGALYTFSLAAYSALQVYTDWSWIGLIGGSCFAGYGIIGAYFIDCILQGQWASLFQILIVGAMIACSELGGVSLAESSFSNQKVPEESIGYTRTGIGAVVVLNLIIVSTFVYGFLSAASHK